MEEKMGGDCDRFFALLRKYSSHVDIDTILIVRVAAITNSVMAAMEFYVTLVIIR
jgi:hypothetical protein